MVWVKAPVAAGVLPPAVSWGESLKPSLLQADVQQSSLTSDLPVKVDKTIWGVSHITAQQIKRDTSGHRPSQNEHRLDIFCKRAGFLSHSLKQAVSTLGFCCCCCHFSSCWKQHAVSGWETWLFHTHWLPATLQATRLHLKVGPFIKSDH